MDTGTTSQDNPGAVDNTLTIDPSDDRWADPVSKWKDGQTYTLEHVTIRQIEPGKFEVMSLEAESEGDKANDQESSAEDVGEQQGANAEAKGRGEYPNDSVAKLMAA